MKLLELQKRFTYLVAELIGHAYSLGFALTFGETWRPPETAVLYAKQGKGIKNSLHCDRLAIDLNLFRGDNYLVDVESYRPLGEFWETLGTSKYRTIWGGSWGSDAGHFSVGFGGRK